jgi:hypothetical protein
VVRRLPLVRDVLDKQVYDRNDLKVGKVDGIELHMPTAWRRLSPRLGRLVERVQRWLAPDLAEPTRIQFEHVVATGIDVKVDIDATRTNAFAWEAWLEKHFVEKLPGGRVRGDKE